MFAKTQLAERDGNNAESIYERIRNEILAGELEANARLKITALAKQYNTSTNPVREAVQQLRGEGLVLFTPNQGARVRPIDMDYVRDVAEVGYLIEPYLMRLFVETVTQEDLDELEAIQDQIELINFSDKPRHTELNHRFHELMYVRHYNRVAFGLWRQHREIMGAISRRIPIAIGRQEAILREHRELIDAARRQDVDMALQVLGKHIHDAGRHLVSQLRIEQSKEAKHNGR